ncbi:hypothetical protein BDZ45DRAFT_676418 [Acephala macrosclerotiorum]|nr:hypothetical protein BDZ45DRAFT_676418 [Acephala macrosclerotiorum]
MKYTTTLLVASAAIATAQFTIENGTIICTGNPNGAYCASDSLQSNIIIRCTNGIGQGGNCNDDLSGYFPISSEGSECWETNSTSGDAACAKNCIVECGSGNCGESFTLPNCTPSATQSSSTASSTSVSSTSSLSSESTTTSTPTTTPSSSSITVTSTGTSICTTGGTTTTITFTTTYCPESTFSTSTYPTSTPPTTIVSTSIPLSTSFYVAPTGGSSSVPSNGTITGSATKGSATATPVGPSSSTSASPSAYTGGASTYSGSAGAGLAGMLLFVAYFL